MISALSIVSVVTLYCDVSQSYNGNPEPSESRIFTVDYDSQEIYVVAGDRKGRVLKAKNVTAVAIEFPDFVPLDFLQTADPRWTVGGTETINRSNGEYLSRHFMIAPPVFNMRYEDRGTCRPGEVIPFPTAQF